MTSRAVSSVLDVTVCLLLITASAATLTHAPTARDSDESDRADAALEVVTTSTAWIEYAPADGSGPNRTAHGTLANLVVAGAVTNATVDGDPLSPSASFRRAVTAGVRRAMARVDVRVQVLARWRPHSGSHGQGRFVVGPSPPPSATVHAASTTVLWEPTETAKTVSVGGVRLTVRTWSP